MARRPKTIDLGQDWGVPLADIPAYGDIKPWRLAVALDVSGPRSASAFSPSTTSPARSSRIAQTGSVPPDGYRWTGGAPKALVKPGDVVYVEPIAGAPANTACARFPGSAAPAWRWIRYRPGAGDGRRLFVRPVRVQPRDPGPAPAGLVVQAVRLRAALDKGYTPSSSCWMRRCRSTRARRSGRRRTSKAPRRHAHAAVGIEHSINLMTVRLARSSACRRSWNTPSVSASTTICRRYCRCRSARARRRCCA